MNIGDGVDNAAWTKNICVFCEKSWGDNASLMLAGFEVGVGEKEEKRGEGVFSEVVGKELHGVCTDYRNILVRSRVRFGITRR